VPRLFFEWLHKTLADFNNVWHATSKKTLKQTTIVLPTSL